MDSEPCANTNLARRVGQTRVFCLAITVSGADKTAGNPEVTPDEQCKPLGGLRAEFRSVQQTTLSTH